MVEAMRSTMSGRLRTIGLKVRLLVAFLLIGILPVAAVGLFALNRANADLTDKAGLRVEGVAVEAGELLDRGMEKHYRDLIAFAHIPIMRMGPQTTELLDILIDSYETYDLMVLVDAEGRVQAVNTIDHDGEPLDTSALDGLDLSAEPWFQAFADGRTATDVYYTDVDANPLLDLAYDPGRLGLTFSAGVTENGQFAGVWHAVVSFERTVVDAMHEIEHELRKQGAETASGMVIRQDGTIVYSEYPEDILAGNLVADGIEAASEAVQPSALGYTIERDIHGGGDLIYGYGNADGVHEFPGFGWGVIVEQRVSEATASTIALRRGVLLFGLVTAVIVAAVGYWLARGVANPISCLTDRATLIAGGATDVEPMTVDRSDEIGVLASTFNGMTTMLGAVGRQTRAIASGRLSDPVLDERLPGDLGESLVTMVEAQRDTVAQLKSSCATLNTAAGELSGVAASMEQNADQASNEAMAAATSGDEVSSNVADVAAAIEEMNATIQEVARNAAAAADVALEAVELSRTTSQRVEKLGESSEQIGAVIGVIDSIAEQTNLLALNATIEAARAGEAGKGFAVVANEVKELANQTASATEDITARIEAIQSDTGEAVAANTRIGEAIDQISEISASIASAVEQQSATTTDIGKSVEVAAAGTNAIAQRFGSVATAADETRRSTSEARANTEELTRLASELDTLVSRYS